jgi:hypothetical protein
MTSIAREKNGRRTIQFVGADGRRRSVWLGKVSQRTAESIKTRVEILNAAKIAGHAVDGDTAGWVANLDAVLADKLAAVGLVPRRQRATLAAFLDCYIDGRCDVKPRTRLWYRQTRENLVAYFGAGKPLHEMTEGDAENWRLHLIGKGYAEATRQPAEQVRQTVLLGGGSPQADPRKPLCGTERRQTRQPGSVLLRHPRRDTAGD